MRRVWIDDPGSALVCPDCLLVFRDGVFFVFVWHFFFVLNVVLWLVFILVDFGIWHVLIGEGELPLAGVVGASTCNVTWFSAVEAEILLSALGLLFVGKLSVGTYY